MIGRLRLPKLRRERVALRIRGWPLSLMDTGSALDEIERFTAIVRELRRVETYSLRLPVDTPLGPGTETVHALIVERGSEHVVRRYYPDAREIELPIFDVVDVRKGCVKLVEVRCLSNAEDPEECCVWAAFGAPYEFHPQIAPATVGELLEMGVVDIARLWIELMPPVLAYRFVRSYERVLRAFLEEVEHAGSPAAELVAEWYRAQARFVLGVTAPESIPGVRIVYEIPPLVEELGRTDDLFRVRLVVGVTGESPKEVAQRVREAREEAARLGMLLHFPAFGQHRMLYGNVVQKTYAVNRVGLRVFYPFLNEELRDPDGVLLGVSIAGHPVVIDIFSRIPPGMLIIGSPRYGKSTTIKVMILRAVRRAVARGEDLIVLGIDPQGEYEKIAREIGAQFIEVGSSSRINVDPVAVGLDPAECASIIMKLIGLHYGAKPERYAERQNLIATVLRRSSEEGREVPSIAALASRLKDHDPELADMVHGLAVDYEDIFTGTPFVVAGSTIVSLRGLYWESDVRFAVMVETVVRKLWQAIERGEVPYTAYKLFFVDELWIALERSPELANVVEAVLRMGGKRRTFFVGATQNPREVLLLEVGRSLVGKVVWSHCSLKLLLRHDPGDLAVYSELEKRAEIRVLTERIREILPMLCPGEGVLIANEGVVRLRVVLTPHEFELIR